MPGILKHLHLSLIRIANKEYFLEVKYFRGEYKYFPLYSLGAALQHLLVK